MTRRYKAGVERGQGQLLPMRVEDYVSEDNPVRALDTYVESLDLRALGVTNTADGVSAGQPAYPPAALLKLYLYGYLMRVRSSRRLEAECYRNLEVMWLLRGLKPCHKTIADFRRDNAEALQAVHRDFVQLCRELDLYGRELVAIDGSFFAGDAGARGIHTRDQLNRRVQRIEADIERYLQALDEVDRSEAEAAAPGGDDDADALREKLERLRERQAREADRLARLQASGGTQLSEVDPDARRLSKNGRVVCGYNVQLAIDGRLRLIIDGVATGDGNDRHQLQPMAGRAADALGMGRFTVVADGDYFNPAQMRACEGAGITPYVPEPRPRGPSAATGRVARAAFTFDAGADGYRCPRGAFLARQRVITRSGQRQIHYASHRADCACCPIREACLSARTPYREIYRSEHEEWLEGEHRPRMEEGGREAMRRRAEMSEHPFATGKRWLGWDHFLVRGLERVNGELGLVMLAYNFRRVLNVLGPRALRAAIAARARHRSARSRSGAAITRLFRAMRAWTEHQSIGAPAAA
ncbi:IS1182 family transposase [Halofilum ochraceum]|uniref:IS1182 family transposase n=1 Tax=Halofilum ochraceum TaxID=1611323 RepID=UPI00082D924C|nr:IS1182 family transposase [Halofilum ochraceum]